MQSSSGVHIKKGENNFMIEATILEQLEERTIIEMVPVNSIGLDMSYQRPLSKVKVQSIKTNFNKHAVGTLIVSLRDDGKIFVIDGQHRLEAMKKRGIENAECKIISGLTGQQEAEIYIWCNTNRKNPDALDTFKARLYKGDPIALTISSVVEECGLYIAFNHTGSRPRNSVWAVMAMEDIYKKGKEKLLKEVLILATRSWPDDSNNVEAKVLLGIMIFHLKYQGRYVREEFIAKMNITDLNTLRRRAQYHAENHGGSVVTTFARALQEAYDKSKHKNRLEPK
jgi:hypothetical protein